MRILHLADLHFDLEHYAWLEKQAANYDLVVIAGDMLERFASDTPLPAQRQLVLASLRRTAQRCRWLAVCTGNHDTSSKDGDWLASLGRISNCIVDNQNKIIGVESKILVTCCFWSEPRDLRGEYRLEKLLEEGTFLRTKYKAAWFIVHHSPPGFGLEGEPLIKVIRAEKPDIVFSGHDHPTPFTDGPFNRLGSTLCLNPGSPPKGQRLGVPPVIMIDTAARTVVWQWGQKADVFELMTPYPQLL